VEKKETSGIVLLVLMLGLLKFAFNIQLVEAKVSVTSGWLSFPVAFDGRMTKAEEWSDATPVDLTLLERHVGPRNVSARVWIKNDHTWLYMMHRVEWPAWDTDPFDGGYIEHFWDWIDEPSPLWAHSDLGVVVLGNTTLDCYGWDEVNWYNDLYASPPGEDNVEGAATHDGTYYWFEFRKELNSSEVYDFSFTPGQVVETGDLLVGIWDNSKRDYFEAFISLHLSPPPPFVFPNIVILAGVVVSIAVIAVVVVVVVTVRRREQKPSKKGLHDLLNTLFFQNNLTRRILAK